MANLIKLTDVESKIITLRGQKVILDSDVAQLYGIETMRVNEAVKNNPDKFPDGYILELNSKEWADLKSKISISSWGGKNKLPKAFTERGLYMLATILKSSQAVQTTLAIVETFTQIRELTRTIKEISQTKEPAQQKSLMQKSGDIIADIISDDLVVDGTETTFEINLAMLSFKHITKKKRKSDIK
jgi:phage regulator Rha-like protein